MTHPSADPSEIADITSLLVAVGRPEPERVAPLLVSYHRALVGWRELGRAVVGPHTWPAHAVGPATPSDRW